MPEAARALIDLAFKELELHKIELTCFGYNVQSQRVAEKRIYSSKLVSETAKDAQGNRCDSLIYGFKVEWEVDCDVFLGWVTIGQELSNSPVRSLFSNHQLN